MTIIMQQWKIHPPMHRMLEALVGHKPSEPPPAAKGGSGKKEQNLRELMDLGIFQIG